MLHPALTSTQTKTLAMVAAYVIVRNTPPGQSAVAYVEANRDGWLNFTESQRGDVAVATTGEATSTDTTSALETTMRETTSYRRTTNPAQIPTEEEEVYKRKLGHMQSEIMLLKTQHQLELETLRKQLTTLKRGKRKKGRETNADGVSDDHVVSKDKDDINFNTLPQICDNTLAHGPISASSRAFLVLKNLHNIQRNLHALQHLQSDLDTGAPTAAHSPMGMSEASESESAAWAAADSMRKVIEELTAAVISETCKWVSVPVSTAAIKPFKTILERYRSHLGLIQECCPFLPSESQHIMSVYRALERSWEQLISFYFDTTTAATKHDSILYLYLLILESVFGLLLNNPELVMEAKETLPLLALPAPQYTHFCPQYSVTIAYFLRTALEVIVRQMKLVVEMESSGWASASSSQASSSFSTAATTALSFAPRAAKATRSVTQDKSMTRLHAAHFSLRAKNHSQQIKEGCGWIMRQLLDALKTPTTRQLIQHALNADQSRRVKEEIQAQIQQLSSLLQPESVKCNNQLSLGWQSEMLMELIVSMPF